jgi:hypothetical protein
MHCDGLSLGSDRTGIAARVILLYIRWRAACVAPGVFAGIGNSNGIGASSSRSNERPF